MTPEQIETYEYCKKYLGKLKEYREKLPFGSQEFGCSSKSPKIEHNLERIHKDMWEKIFTIMNETQIKVNKIIEKL